MLFLVDGRKINIGEIQILIKTFSVSQSDFL